MVKKKITPSQDGMKNTTVEDYFRVAVQTTKDKNEEKLSENVEIIEFSEGTTNDNNSNTKINRTEEATKSSKANTETTEEKTRERMKDQTRRRRTIKAPTEAEMSGMIKIKIKTKNKIKIKILIIKKSISTKERRRQIVRKITRNQPTVNQDYYNM